MTSRTTASGPADDGRRTDASRTGASRTGSSRSGAGRPQQAEPAGDALDRLTRRDLVLLRMQAGKALRRRPGRGRPTGLAAAEGLAP